MFCTNLGLFLWHPGIQPLFHFYQNPYARDISCNFISLSNASKLYWLLAVPCSAKGRPFPQSSKTFATSISFAFKLNQRFSQSAFWLLLNVLPFAYFNIQIVSMRIWISCLKSVIAVVLSRNLPAALMTTKAGVVIRSRAWAGDRRMLLTRSSDVCW